MMKDATPHAICEIKVDSTKPFANKTERFGALVFAHSLLNDQDWFEKLWQSKKAISDKPVLFVWGMKDPLIKPNYLQKFLDVDFQIMKFSN